MAANIEQSSLVLDNLFKRAKRFYSQSKSNGENRKISQHRKPPEQSVSNVSRNSLERNRSKDVKEILKVEAAASPEIPSGNGSSQGVRNTENLGDYCEAETCGTLNTEKLTEIINSSIKAAVRNLADDGNPPCWRQGEEPIESSCFNDTCTQRIKSTQNKENVVGCTQYSQQAIPCVIPNVCGIYAGKNGSKSRSWNSHRRTSPTRCVPPSKSGTWSSVICDQSSVTRPKQMRCPSVKKHPDKASKSGCKPCKPCRHVKADNRRMTGNVNIYICSEGNDGAVNKKKKPSESTCNSTTLTNASCACSSTDVSASRSSSSSKTIRDLIMEKRKKVDSSITLKCICGKLPSNCDCSPVKSENDEGLCLCEMSSLNPTASNETTCRDATDYDFPSPNTSESLPQGDYCTRRIRSGSSSEREPRCTRQNLATFGRIVCPEDDAAGPPDDKSRFPTGNSGRGDALRECSCCETFSDYSEDKVNDVCACCDPADPPLRNQRERSYPGRNDYHYLPRDDQVPCNCCAYNENASIYSNGGKNDVDRSVCCQITNANESRKDCCTKPRDNPRGSICDGNNREQPRYTDHCIMEEDETCDASSCQSPPSTKEQSSNRLDTLKTDSKRFYRKDSDDRKEESDAIEPHQEIDEAKQDDANEKRMSVAEVVKSYSNADKSTSSNVITPRTTASPLAPVSKDKSIVQQKSSVEKESRRSSLKWPFDKAKSLIASSKNKVTDSKKDKSPTDASKPRTDVKSLTKNLSKPNGIGKNPKTVTETRRKNSSSVAKSSLIAIKSSVIGEAKSTELVVESNKSKLSSSRLGSLIAERKNSALQTLTDEKSPPETDDASIRPCTCGAPDPDVCTCQHPQCPCCRRPREDCGCDNPRENHPREQSCDCCKNTKRLCCCCSVNPAVPEDDGFRVCTLCCKSEKDCRCNSGGRVPRGPGSPSSNSCKKTVDDRRGLINRKSEICLYCEKRLDKCTCRMPIKKCSYCGMPMDVCNCQDMTGCCYDENICQCNGRLIQNADDRDQGICVTAWKPRRDVRKYFSRNPASERDNPDCPCCDTMKPYGSDELPYQRLRVFSDVMNELQQKISELPCCNRCGKTPCCCYLQETKSCSSPTNEVRPFATKQRKSRSSRSPAPYRNCVCTSPCKCGGRKNPPRQNCNRCRTTPCRCRKSRSTQRKPQAKCYYCKFSPCRCESAGPNAITTSTKSCRCTGSPQRSQAQASSPLPDRNNSSDPRPCRGCRCHCGNPSCGSPSRVQERPCG